MPLTNFICPDGVEISTESCLKQCRMKERCATKPTLLAIKDREFRWDGIPHITELLNGTRESFLKITKPYSVSSDSMAFALHGSVHHKLLEQTTTPDTIVVEVGFKNSLQGTADLLEYDNKSWTLTDYKTWGSYKLGMVLGIVKLGKGKNAEFRIVPGQRDTFDLDMQLNIYRIKLQQLGYTPIKKLQAQVTVRDGGLAIAASRGITRNIYIIPVKILDDDYVLEWFTEKATILIEAVDSNTLPMACNNHETWNLRKCKKYCNVWQDCPQGVMVRGG